MPEGLRGVIGSHSSGPRQVPQAPRLMTTVTAPEPRPAADVIYHAFVCNVSRYHQYKINAYRGDAEDEALTRAVLSYPEHWSGVIQFNEYTFATPHESVARWLDGRIKQGRARGISRDATSIMLRCSSCDFIRPNTEAGRMELVDHMIVAHTNDASGFYRPITVGDFTQPGEAPRIATPEEIDPPAPLVEIDHALVREGNIESLMDFALGGELVPPEVMAEMEAEDAGDQDAERVPVSKPERRRG